MFENVLFLHFYDLIFSLTPTFSQFILPPTKSKFIAYHIKDQIAHTFKSESPFLRRIGPASRALTPVVLLVIVVTAGWCVMLNRLDLRAWETPLRYTDDSLIVLARIKSAADGHYSPFLSKRIPALGVPFIANWDGHPVSEDWLYTLTGLLARRIGLIPTANLAFLISRILAALSFYACCRALRSNREWSLVCALAFAWSPFAFSRSLSHIMLAFDWLVPPNLLLCIWIASRESEEPWGRPCRLALLIGLATGLHNSYYAFLFGQGLVLAGIVRLVRTRRWQVLLLPLTAGGAVLLGWLSGNTDSLGYLLGPGGGVVSVMRGYPELEIFALRPLALLTPFSDHRWHWWAHWGNQYRAGTGITNEAFYAYMGMLGIAAATWMAGLCLARVLRRPVRSLPAQAWLILWIVLFSVAGGGNALLGLAGFTLFRATNRYSIAILALALLFLAQRLSQVTQRWPAWFRLAIATALCLLAAWDQLPRQMPLSRMESVLKQVRSDRAFAAAMETRLPAGAMVYQLPVMDFPESPPIQNMGDYEHFRPYLYSTRLRFSYGNHTSDALAGWQDEMAQLAPSELAAALERIGFAAIQVNRRGYADGGASLIEALRRAGRMERIESALGDLVCIRLKPSSQTRLPEVGPSFSYGWFPVEVEESGQKRHWSRGNARMPWINTADRPVIRTLSFEISTAAPRHVRLSQEGETLADVDVSPGQWVRVTGLKVTLKSGFNVLDWTTDAPPVYPPNPDSRKLAFVVRNFRFMKQP